MSPLLLPVVAVQGLSARRRIPLLPTPDDPTEGIAGDGTGGPIRLAVVGESTAAGVGTDSHNEAFAAHLARDIAESSGCSVQWRVIGQNGATAHRIRYTLAPLLTSPVEIAVLLAGANDVMSRRSVAHWRDDLEATITALSSHAQRVVMTGIPPFETFPSLPNLLRRYLAERAQLLNEVSRELCERLPKTTWLAADPTMTGDDFFASDQFHPSSVGYQRWAQDVANHIRETGGIVPTTA